MWPELKPVSHLHSPVRIALSIHHAGLANQTANTCRARPLTFFQDRRSKHHFGYFLHLYCLSRWQVLVRSRDRWRSKEYNLTNWKSIITEENTEVTHRKHVEHIVKKWLSSHSWLCHSRNYYHALLISHYNCYHIVISI